MNTMKKIALLTALLFLLTGTGFAADQTIASTEEMVGSGHATKSDTLNRLTLVEHYTDGTHKYQELAKNLKPTVNASVNKLDVFAKSNGAAPSATNVITVAIPDGSGYTFRSRSAAVASGTGQIVLADAANYWSKGSLNAEIKTAYLYAIWSTADSGIVWAVSGYSGFTRVPAAGGAATDDDWFLLEASSSYTAVITDYLVAVGKIRYEYDTADAPDYDIQATVLDAPQVLWNPRSDYGYTKTLATSNTSGSNIADYSAVSLVVKQSGKYLITGQASGACVGGTAYMIMRLKTGSATYGSATTKVQRRHDETTADVDFPIAGTRSSYMNAGDTIHLGLQLAGASGNRIIYGDNQAAGATSITFQRVD